MGRRKGCWASRPVGCNGWTSERVVAGVRLRAGQRTQDVLRSARKRRPCGVAPWLVPDHHQDWTDDVAALLDYLKIPSADLIGYSLGGGVAMQCAIRHPEKVRKVVSISYDLGADRLKVTKAPIVPAVSCGNASSASYQTPTGCSASSGNDACSRAGLARSTSASRRAWKRAVICSMMNNGTRKAGISKSGNSAIGAVVISLAPPVARMLISIPVVTATTRSRMPSTFQTTNQLLAAKPGRRISASATQGAVMPMAMSPNPAGQANAPGRTLYT